MLSCVWIDDKRVGNDKLVIVLNKNKIARPPSPKGEGTRMRSI